MEPTIKTNSLVLVRTYDDSVQLEKGNIIAFRANRFGENIVIMHRFSHTETNADGQTVYRTYPEGSDALDVYETTVEISWGVYLFHIPYIGKFVLFAKSGIWTIMGVSSCRHSSHQKADSCQVGRERKSS